jgi:hypothetical protein
MFVPDPEYFHNGSRIKKAPDPEYETATKNSNILTQKLLLSSGKYECLSRIPDLFSIPDPGVKKALDPDPQHCTNVTFAFGLADPKALYGLLQAFFIERDPHSRTEIGERDIVLSA